MPDEEEFIRLVRKREASLAVGPSTARGMPEGTVKQARDFLGKLDLSSFATDSEHVFRERLDEATDKLKELLTCRSWGAARKFLNIFLRGALYNRFLCEHYRLCLIEKFFEVPLDRSVAEGLRRERNGETLPQWDAIKRLQPQESAAYQTFARSVAREKRCARVHLDLWYWRQEEVAGAGSPQEAKDAVGVARVLEGGGERVVHIPSPRLVNPHQATDFAKVVADAGKDK
ncbi:MAG: hypothetical protein ACLQLG_13010 [Thermoguttaceae bacterium]